MDTVTMKLYEGLFLVDSVEAAADWQGTIDSIEIVLTRAGAEVVSSKKWDERKLAYEVKKKSRGTYILVYFNCDPLKITGIERDVQLSETILRVMILTTDRMSTDDIEKPTPVDVVEQAKEAAEAAAAAAAEAAVVAAAEAAAAAEAEAAAVQEEAPAEEETVAEEAPVEEAVTEEPAPAEEEAPEEEPAPEEEAK